MRTTAFRYSICALRNLSRPRLKRFCSPTSLRELLPSAAPPYTQHPYTLHSTSVNSSAVFTVICCPLQRHSVAYNALNLRTYSSLPLLQFRHFASRTTSSKATNTVRYIVATTIVVLGLSYAAVPLYRLFCQASGYGGTVTKTDAGDKVEQMEPDRERSIVVRYALVYAYLYSGLLFPLLSHSFMPSMSVVKIKILRNFACILTLCVRCHSVLAMIRFNADTSAGMRWQFKPQQKDITVSCTLQCLQVFNYREVGHVFPLPNSPLSCDEKCNVVF